MSKRTLLVTYSLIYDDEEENDSYRYKFAQQLPHN